MRADGRFKFGPQHLTGLSPRTAHLWARLGRMQRYTPTPVTRYRDENGDAAALLYRGRHRAERVAEDWLLKLECVDAAEDLWLVSRREPSAPLLTRFPHAPPVQQRDLLRAVRAMQKKGPE